MDRLILACFVLGLSTRKVASAPLPILGEQIFPSAVSRIAQKLDQAVSVFHRRKVEDSPSVLILDGVGLARKTGLGAIRRPILVALGLCPDGRNLFVLPSLCTSCLAFRYPDYQCRREELPGRKAKDEAHGGLQ